MSKYEIHEVMEFPKVTNWIDGAIVTALYQCAGSDTMPLTFTHPEFFLHRNVYNILSPNLFVYVDRKAPSDINQSLEFSGEFTRITSKFIENFKVGSFQVYLFNLRWQSLRAPVWHRRPLVERKLSLLYCVGEQERMSVYAYRKNWVPDFFIGVTDGHRFGGNKNPVNKLTTHGMQSEAARSVPVSRYYITDHFLNEKKADVLHEGEYIYSLEPGFPFKFKKIALLSTKWGRYGQKTVLGGATLFEVMLV
ncbi:hypothetical protein ACFL27_11890 [candidate division CSSED10-310 bacterium]|uniref:Uncharacterized protein n=1 Tax=candidate division CSSED10-310 bacterium TaxID=2855610 RepID=A0ABV6YXF2_UNCC1